MEYKTEFIERIERLFESKEDLKKFLKISNKHSPKTIRCNTLKISPEKLKARLEDKGWEIEQPIRGHPEIMRMKSLLKPGALGKSIEHLLGYFYSQGISSMLPIILLKPKRLFLDLCAAPGSKTTQASIMMGNKGVVIANDKSGNRVKILRANIERMGCANVLITRHKGSNLCNRLRKTGLRFDSISLDPKCSEEGNSRDNPKIFRMWNKNKIKKYSSDQKKLAKSAISILKPKGTLIYSTCTYAPEENEEVVSYILNNFNVKIEKINLKRLGLEGRKGIKEWRGKSYDPGVEKAVRIYPQDNNTGGFFIAKIKKE